MKKIIMLLLALGLYASCTPTQLEENENDIQQSCPAPDTNCNGIPDHEEGIGSGG